MMKSCEGVEVYLHGSKVEVIGQLYAVPAFLQGKGPFCSFDRILTFRMVTYIQNTTFVVSMNTGCEYLQI